MDKYFDSIWNLDEEDDLSHKSRKGGAKYKKKPQKSVASRSCRRDINELKILGVNINHLPRDYWCEGCLFFGFSDETWKERTGGAFPKKVKTSHPLYVLAVSQLGETVCPTTSKEQTPAYIIRKGFTLEITGEVTTQDSYVLKKLAFPLAPEEDLEEQLSFRGIYPLGSLES